MPEARLYDHGPQHPLRPDRVLLTWDLIEATGLDRAPGVRILGAEPADDDELERVHTRRVHRRHDGARATARTATGRRFGYGPGDNPIFPDMHEAGALVCRRRDRGGAEPSGAGETAHAFNAAGGLHHAMPARASGFCVYDDPAVAIAWLLGQGAERVAYVDVDVHHGDGVAGDLLGRAARADDLDPRVRATLFFPGTGAISRARRAERAGHGDQHPAAAGHR